MSGAEGREEFESAANASDWGIGLIFDYDPLYQTYFRMNTQSLWLVWQASRSQALEEAAATCRDIAGQIVLTAEPGTNSGLLSIVAENCADAILALKKGG